MRGRLAAAKTALALLGGAAALLLGQCFAPTYNDCAFQCAKSAPQCPDEYECRGDNYCHLKHSPDGGSCPSLDQTSPSRDAAGGD
jgi:hypothetical protein